jgi:AraC-like DNA-binding protein
VRILPNACVDIVLYASDASTGEGLASIVAPPHRSYVVGSTLSAFMVRSMGWRHVIGASLRPEGVAPILGVPASDIGERVAFLHDLIGNGAQEMEDRVLSGPTATTLERLAAVLLDRVTRAPIMLDPITLNAAQIVRKSRGRARMDALTRDLNVSPRKLERHFLTHVGMSPKLFSRLIRFDRAARNLAKRGERSWTEFALAHGYSDQAHFINEFREFAGVTPTEFEAETRT